ncbi:MAG TPA: hypothetical protein VJC39_01345 [Candidatus Nanoarchaeia archaeon]|nr:hypothetical protein [Candidatus Nanoarchaeia archaeon]
MTITLLAHFKEEPRVAVTLHNCFPLAENNPALTQFYEHGVPHWDELRTYLDARAQEQGIDRAIYINPQSPLEWRELLLTLPGLEQTLKQHHGSDIHLDGYKIDSFTIQAQRKKALPDYSAVQGSIYGFATTADKLLLGERGGSDRVGQFVSVPVGSIPFPVGYSMGSITINPMKDAVITEGMEEAGIQAHEVNYRLIGIFKEDHPMNTAVNASTTAFVYHGALTIPAEQVMARHEGAMEIYRSLGGGKGVVNDEIKARHALEEQAAENPSFPKDAWENATLNIIDNDPAAIIARVDTIHGAGSRLFGGLYGALPLYFLQQFGEKECQKLLDNGPFKAVQQQVLRRF